MQDNRLPDKRKIHAGKQKCQAPECIARKRAVEVRPFEAKKKLLASEAQGLSAEAMKGEPDDDGNPQSRWEQDASMKGAGQYPEELSEPVVLRILALRVGVSLVLQRAGREPIGLMKQSG